MIVRGPSPWLTQSGLALDRASVRMVDHDGRLHVAVANVSKATVNPYYGHEVPDAGRLGLDPNRVYRLLRDPAELAKAAPTFNNLPILSDHEPVSVNDHRPELVVGSTGTDARFVAPFMQCSLVFWAASAVQAITSGAKRELSAAYRYVPVIQSGTYEGARFSIRMTQIRANHISIVDQGRAGPDVVVGDAAFKPGNDTMDDMTLTKLMSYLQDTLNLPPDQIMNVQAIIDEGKSSSATTAVAQDHRRRIADALGRQRVEATTRRTALFPNANRLG